MAKNTKTSSALGTAQNQPPLQSNPAPAPANPDQNGAVQEEITQLRLELEALRREKAQKESACGKDSQAPPIPRPRGSNFSLQEAMMLEDDNEQYKGLRHAVRDAVRFSGADCQRTWRKQDFVKLSAIKAVVLQRQPYFKKYEDEWPIGEFIRSHMKNMRAYQRRLEKEKAEDGKENENENQDENGDKNGDKNRDENQVEGNVERQQ
ncbi:hypothetical protein JOM56_014557 [Amanita muscaria]